jgi:alpha-tubulin suppressor-like RCC1 family protein
VTRRGRAIPGAVRLIDGPGLVAAFIPDGPFAPNADHRLEITTGVRDEQGEPLDRLTPVDFTTGTTLVGPPAFIRVSPDTVEMTSLTYQLSATVMDQSENELAEEPLTWSVADGAGISVSATGLVAAFAEGDFRVWVSLRDDPAVLGGTTVKVRSKDPPVTFSIAPAPGLVALEDTLALTAVLRDEAGRALDRQVTWSSSDPAVASVESRWQGDRSATLITRRTGSVTITATSGTMTTTSVVNVTPPRTVASIALATEPLAVLASTPTRIDRILRDADGREIFVRQLSWTPDDPTIATVDANGVVTGLRAGSTSVRAEIDGASARLTVVVSTIDFTAVVAGSSYSCALTAAGVAHCSGRIFGEGGFLSSEVPVAMAGDVVFESLSAGSLHVCGLTSAGLAHCWGSNFMGALGNSVTTFSARPVPVDGGHVFSTLTTGDAHACGLTADGVAYCWGSNTDGELGNGSFGSSAWSATPVRVGGDHRFVRVAAGFRKTCGLKADATAWCWGRNANGELGNGSTDVRSAVPTLVTTAPTFSALGSGATASHTCAAHCWGNNSVGQLGTMTGLGTVNTVRTPAAVEGGQTFTTVSSGSGHSCGVATSGAAFCWGSNADGRLGTGKGGVGPPNPFDLQPAPVVVVGGIRFASLSVGGGHTCGMSTDGIAYCWGAGSQGQLGGGAKTSSNIPQKVGGQP